MVIRPFLGIPILFVALGLGAIMSLPVLMASIDLRGSASKCSIDLQRNTAKADRILTGRVEAVLTSAHLADVWIEPLTWYKGQTADRFLRIQAQPTKIRKGTTGDLHFASGQPPYLLFLRKTSGVQYRTSRCYGSRLLGAGLTAAETAAFGRK